MSDINSISISGRVGKEPELKYTAGGMAICTFSVAVQGYSKQGDNPTHWVDCKAFDKLAEVIGSRVPKGGRVFVHGELQQEKWQAKDGGNRSRIVVNARQVSIVDWIDTGQAAPQTATQGANATKPQETAQTFDDIPF